MDRVRGGVKLGREAKDYKVPSKKHQDIHHLYNIRTPRAHDKTGGGRACNFHSILYVRAEYLLPTINRHFR